MSEPLELPDKLLFRIGEVCDLLGVRPHVLRFWETEFPAVRPEKSRSNQRLYRRRDVELLAEVKRLLYEEGYTIAGARKRLHRGGARPEHPAEGPGDRPASGPPPAAWQPEEESRGLHSQGPGRIRGPASATPPADPAGPAAVDPTTAAELAARCAALERELEAERARGKALRELLRAELGAIARLTEEPPESNGA